MKNLPVKNKTVAQNKSQSDSASKGVNAAIFGSAVPVSTVYSLNGMLMTDTTAKSSNTQPRIFQRNL